jgi:MFS family permease
VVTPGSAGSQHDRRSGRRLLAGVAVFTLASLACGIAPGIGVLIGARFVQGAGAAAMMPQIMSVIQVRFDGAARARALSAYTAVLSSGFVAGQVVGGVLVTANLFGQTWRPVFLVNVPIGLTVLALVPRVVPRDEAGQRQRQLDLAGLAIAVPAVFLVVLPLMLGHQENWPGWVFACIAVGLVLAGVFVRVERRIADRGGDPLLNLAVLRAPGLGSGLAAVAVLMITYGGFLFSFALHLQGGLGDSALRAGLTFAPCALVFGACGYFWRRLSAGWHHLLAPLGCLVAVGGYLAVAFVLRSGGSGGGAAAGGADRHRRRAGPRVQPAGHARPGPGAAAARGGRQRAADHDHPARAGGRGGHVRQPVPDPGHRPGHHHRRDLRARAGHHDELAGRGHVAGRGGRDPAGADRGGDAALRGRGRISPSPDRRFRAGG